MKSLVLKDLYNIGHNAKSLIFMLVILTVAIVPAAGVGGYLVMCTILCSMMTVTTFTFDDMAGWTPYALVMPVTRKAVVQAKYAVLAVFSTVGAALGLVTGGVAGAAMGMYTSGVTAIAELAVTALVGWAVAFGTGSIAIPLVFRFGAERARFLLILSYLIPGALFAGVYGLMELTGLSLSHGMQTALLCASPLMALVWGEVMYQIACGIFARKEY